jgi:hypothetical protein
MKGNFDHPVHAKASQSHKKWAVSSYAAHLLHKGQVKI